MTVYRRMARNYIQRLKAALDKHCHGIIQISCTSAIIIGGTAYLKGVIPTYFASCPKLLGDVAALVIACKGLAYFKSYRDLKQELFTKDGGLAGRLKRFVKYLIGVTFATVVCLLPMYISTISNALIGIFNRFIEEENNYLLEWEKRYYTPYQPTRKYVAPLLTEVLKVLEITFPAFLKVNKTLCLVICSFFLGVIEIYEFCRCRCKFERQRSKSQTAPESRSKIERQSLETGVNSG